MYRKSITLFRYTLAVFFFAAVSLCSFCLSSVFADKSVTRFLIIVSKRTGPYLKCEKGVRNEIWERCHKPFEIQSIYLDEDDTDAIRQQINRFNPSVAVCIGTRAAFFLKETMPIFPWVATLLVDKSIEAIKRHGFLAVSMDVPIETRMEILCRMKKHVLAGLLSYNSAEEPIEEMEEGACHGRDARILISTFFSSIELALQALIRRHVNAFFITPDPRIFNSQEAVAYTLLWGLRNKIAVCGLSSGYVRNGALYALEADIVALGEQAAQLAIDRIHGRTGEKTVIQHPRKLILSINLKTARRLGIKIPEAVMEKARLVIR